MVTMKSIASIALLGLLAIVHRDQLVFAGEIHEAVARGDVDAVRTILDKDAAAKDAKDDQHGYRPLHKAVQSGQRKAFDLLLERKADVNAADNYGYRPLHWCPYQKQYEMAEALIAAGA